MPTATALADLQARLLAGYPLLFLRTHEEDRWERAIADLSLEIERGLVTWTVTRGLEPPPSTEFAGPLTPIEMLRCLESYPPDHVFLLKDLQPYLDDPELLRKLRDLAPLLEASRQTLLLMSPVAAVPPDLEKASVRIDLPMPDYEDLKAELDDVVTQLGEDVETPLFLSADDEDRLLKAAMGLTVAEAGKAWRRALMGKAVLDEEVFTTLIAEKRALASGSDLLDFYDLDEGVADVGGLDQLKDWLRRRSEAYSPRAREQGIPLPKGVMLLGVQGCGKSLTARATARLLSFPLIRLDIANLLSSGRGESERNLRQVLALVESIAPIVLWLDELEKGFAGLEGDQSADATMSRLIGGFLTWMSEISKPVFVVATANSVHQLPPELLRRGRFDELFFIDLPNYHERRNILEIHLNKRGWKPDLFDLPAIAQQTEGFSGAELEQIVVTALIEAFGHGRVVAQEDLERARRSTVPLSVTMEEKVFELRQWAEARCRRATSDSRVTEMLDEEKRIFGDDDEIVAPKDLPPWAQLAVHGQLKGALVEFVRGNGETLLPELQQALEPYMPVAADFGLALRGNPNTVLWTGMSQDLCELIKDLVASKRLYFHPVDIECYQAIPAGLKLPPVVEPTDEKLPRPCWLPVSLRTAPHPVHHHRLARIGRIKLAGAAE